MAGMCDVVLGLVKSLDVPIRAQDLEDLFYKCGIATNLLGKDGIVHPRANSFFVVFFLQ